MLSEATADTATVPLTVEPFAGAVTDTVGAMVSGSASVVSGKKLLPGETKANDPAVTITSARGRKLLPLSVLENWKLAMAGKLLMDPATVMFDAPALRPTTVMRPLA